MAWATEGIQEYPLVGQLMADTGQIALGINTRFTVLLWGDTGANFDLALRNAADSADLSVQRLRVSADGSLINEVPINVGVNQRVVIRSAGDHTGQFQASLLW